MFTMQACSERMLQVSRVFQPLWPYHDGT